MRMLHSNVPRFVIFYLESRLQVPLVSGQHGDGVLTGEVAFAHQLVVLKQYVEVKRNK